MYRIKPISPVNSTSAVVTALPYLFIFTPLRAGHHGGFMQLHGVGTFT